MSTEQRLDAITPDLNRQGTVVASMTMLSRVSGFVRDVVLSHFFGATGVADAFFVAFRIPNFFRRLFAEGAFSQAFVPVLATYRAANDPAALRRFVQVMLGNFGLLLVVVCVLGVGAAPALVMLFAPGFWGDPVRLELTTDILRVTFPYLGFISLTAFAGSVLNAHFRYALPAFTPVLLNLSLIGAAWLIVPLMDPPVMGLAWGVFLAGVLQLAFQIPALGALGMPLSPRLDRRHPGVTRVVRLVIPAVFASSVSQVNTLVDTVLASLLVTGSISWLYYSDRLMELPIGIVAVAIGTVLLPSLSRYHAAGDTHAMNRSLGWGIRMGVLLGAPAGVALYLLATPLVATIFFHGALVANDVTMAALSLEAFAVGTLGFVVAKIAAPGYFARHDTMTPFRIALVSVAVNLVVSLSLFRFLGHVGLAFATSVAAIVQSYLLVRGLVRLGVYRPPADFWMFLLRVVLALVAMAGVVEYSAPPDAAWLAASSWERMVDLALTCVLGLATYLVALWVTGMRMDAVRYHT